MARLLTDKELAFVERFIELRDPVAAYKAAGYAAAKMKPSSVVSAAGNLLARPKVQQAITERMLPKAEAAGFGATEILRELVDVITADVGELMQYRRTCCRYCHGKNHAYQWKHEAEWARAVAAALDENVIAESRRKRAAVPEVVKEVRPPGNEGGYGFNPTVAPHPECPECFGEGHASTYFADTRYLSPKARKLFAGIKETKDGIQIMVKDQQAALRDLMRLLGADKTALVVQNPDGSAVQPNTTQVAIVNMDPMEAARTYAQFMKGIK